MSSDNPYEKLKRASGYPCPVPWTEISTTPTGEWRMCCYANAFPDMSVKSHTPLEVMTSERMNTIRKAMMEGNTAVYQPWCDRCIVMERQGQVSRRQKRWENLSVRGVNTMVLSNEDTGELGATFFEHFDIKFAGNKCNLRCYMCHPFYSSSVAAEWKKLGWWNGPKHINPFDDLDDTQLERWWQGFRDCVPYIKVLNFTGGEPFLMDDYWAIVQQVISMGGASDMELHFSTNATRLEHRGTSVQSLFDRFKRVHAQVSIDAYGKQYDWIRYPADYSEVIGNTATLHGRNKVDVQVTTVVSALSVWSLPQLLAEMDYLDWGWRFDNVLTDPSYMRVSSLPKAAKDRLRHILTDPCFSGILSLLDEPEVPEHWRQLVAHCDALDRARGTNWREVFPELGELA